MSIRVALTAMTGRIMAGKVNKDGTAFVGEKIDVTSDCLKAVIEMIGVGKTHTVTVDGKPLYEISVRKPG